MMTLDEYVLQELRDIIHYGDDIRHSHFEKPDEGPLVRSQADWIWTSMVR